jgi:hypothetical protein
MVKRLVAGSVRNAVLTRTALSSQAKHELREDFKGRLRSVNDTPPLIYKAGSSAPDMVAAYDEWSAGCRRNAAAKDNLALHALVHFPTELIPLDGTPDQIAKAERGMLDHAVRFINERNGGDAVFWARLDRDEEGRHNVDVFYAPRYTKQTKSKGAERWISLTKFDKEKALERFPTVPKMTVGRDDNGKKIATPALDGAGNQIMIPGNSMFWRGKALQTDFYEYLRDVAKIEGVQRGDEKHTHGTDWLSPEDYKAKKAKEDRAYVKSKWDEYVSARDKKVAAQSRQLADKDKQLEAKDRQLAAKDREIKQANKKLDDLRAGPLSMFIKARKRDVEERATAISNETLSRVLEEKTEFKTENGKLKASLSRSESENKILRKRLDDSEEKYRLVTGYVASAAPEAARHIRDAETTHKELVKERDAKKAPENGQSVSVSSHASDQIINHDDDEATRALKQATNAANAALRRGPGGM